MTTVPAQANRCNRCGGSTYIEEDEEGDVWRRCFACARQVFLGHRPRSPEWRLRWASLL